MLNLMKTIKGRKTLTNKKTGWKRKKAPLGNNRTPVIFVSFYYFCFQTIRHPLLFFVSFYLTKNMFVEEHNTIKSQTDLVYQRF